MNKLCGYLYYIYLYIYVKILNEMKVWILVKYLLIFIYMISSFDVDFLKCEII